MSQEFSIALAGYWQNATLHLARIEKALSTHGFTRSRTINLVELDKERGVFDETDEEIKAFDFLLPQLGQVARASGLAVEFFSSDLRFYLILTRFSSTTLCSYLDISMRLVEQACRGGQFQQLLEAVEAVALACEIVDGLGGLNQPFAPIEPGYAIESLKTGIGLGGVRASMWLLSPKDTALIQGDSKHWESLQQIRASERYIFFLDKPFFEVFGLHANKI